MTNRIVGGWGLNSCGLDATIPFSTVARRWQRRPAPDLGEDIDVLPLPLSALERGLKTMSPRREVVWMREPPAAGKAGACPLAEGTSASERSGSKSSSIWQNAYCSLKRRFHYPAALMISSATSFGNDSIATWLDGT